MNLRTKFTAVIIIIILFSGLVTVLLVRDTMSLTILGEFHMRGTSTARHIAMESADLILTENIIELQHLIENSKVIEPSVVYIFITDPDGRILVHTFKEGFPVDLLKANALKQDQEENIVVLKTAEGMVHDFAYPVLGGKIGIVRVGFSEKYFRQTIDNTILRVAALIAVVLILGIITSFALANLMTRPITELRDAASRIGKGYLDTGIEIRSNDEIGQLAASFKKMTEDLQKTTVSKNYVDNIIRSMFDTLVVTTPEGVIKTLNNAACDLLGYEAEELVGKHVDIILANEKREPGSSWLDELNKKSSISNIEKTYLAKNGKKIPVLFSGSAMHDENGNVQGLVFVAQDITGRKQAEMNILRLNRIYSVLSDINQAIVRIHYRQTLYEEACRIAVEKGLFQMAWIGIADPDTLEVRPAAQSGFVKGYLDKIRISKTDVHEGRGPTGKAIREGKHFICNDIEHDPSMEPWREEAMKRGYRSSAAFPLLIGGRAIGAFMVYAAEPGFFDTEEIRLLDELTADISFALESIEQQKQRERAEEELRASEERYRTTLDSMLEGCQIIGFGWKYLYANDAAAWHGQRAKEELLGRTMMEMYPGIEKTEMFAALKNCMEKRTPHRMENEFTFPDGSKGWFDLSIQPVPEGIFIVSLDITESKRALEALQESERKYRTLIDESQDGIFIIQDAKIQFANEAFGRMAGYNRKEVTGMNFSDLIAPEDVEMVTDRYRRRQAGEDVPRDYEFRMLHRDGKTRIIVNMIVGLINYRGRIASMGTIKDITERKRNEEIRIENERLAYASKAKSDFLANMSHELRTPLNSIIGFSELLKQMAPKELTEKQQHYVDNVLLSSNHLLGLINDILDLSKVEAGKIDLVIEKISLPAVINETLSLIKEKAAKHNVQLEKELDAQLEFIEADKQRFKQIFFNLLSNAVKFSKSEGGTVTIITKKEGNTAKISIRDTGIGIKEEDMRKLFKEFEQLDSGISRRYGGTGLGLAITKKLVELHGGSITVESKYGEGSTFSFAIPVRAG